LEDPGTSNSAPGLATEILGLLGDLYPKISPAPAEPVDPSVPDFGIPQLEVPPIDDLTTRLGQCSFKVFDDTSVFYGSERAKEYVSWSAPRNDVYRIFFNAYSKKVYVDLNGDQWKEIESQSKKEALYCEILRTLVFVLTCEVELSEARDAEQAAEAEGSNAVTSEVTEVIIP
jgi:hypothetical protein